ncbi:hypothetical protein [Bacillus sp. AFS041924]|uniref:hypothetical protein n=1 Tax=Bacillus sp. AFS041924 TaxID=2033503 RepID=UPI000BFD10A4|nr:hypothetical protein [Bacillus sp. AFS041924]PGS51215.1 hypothetical protein COC46_11770 [Bacillus sp. AFS041924]
MESLLKIFNQNKFIFTKETTKAIEFENIHSKEVIYLLPTVEITIALDPKIVEGNVELENKSHGYTHSTALSRFPKRKHTGKDLIHYGYSFKFQSKDELSSFLNNLN